MKFTLTDKTAQALANALSVAAERFKENAAVMDQCAATGGNPMLSPNAATMLAVEFRKQAQEARGFSQVFGSLEGLNVVTYDHDEEDDENPFDPETMEGREWSKQFKALARA